MTDYERLKEAGHSEEQISDALSGIPIKGDIVTLDNGKEYICVSLINYNNLEYAYFLSNFKPVEVPFANIIHNEDEISIKVVNDQNLKKELLSLIN